MQIQADKSSTSSTLIAPAAPMSPPETATSRVAQKQHLRWLEIPSLEAVWVITGRADSPSDPLISEAEANILRCHTSVESGREHRHQNASSRTST